ncbi:MAG: hypothetical protein AB1593_02700 [Pseudomonadota bacterium]
MKRALLPLLVALALLAIAATGWWLKRPAGALDVACSDPVAGCAFSHAGAPARVRFSMVPVPLEAFDLAVEVTDVQRVSAEFQMIGMDMGFNRYDLRPRNGAFASRITLPVCVSNRHDWILYLTLDGQRYAVPFSSR